MTCIGLARIIRSVQPNIPGTSRVEHRTLAEPSKKAQFQVSFTSAIMGNGKHYCARMLPERNLALIYLLLRLLKRQVNVVIYEINLMPFYLWQWYDLLQLCCYLLFSWIQCFSDLENGITSPQTSVKYGDAGYVSECMTSTWFQQYMLVLYNVLQLFILSLQICFVKLLTTACANVHSTAPCACGVKEVRWLHYVSMPYSY